MPINAPQQVPDVSVLPHPVSAVPDNLSITNSKGVLTTPGSSKPMFMAPGSSESVLMTTGSSSVPNREEPPNYEELSREAPHNLLSVYQSYFGTKSPDYIDKSDGDKIYVFSLSPPLTPILTFAIVGTVNAF
jgi:hypothetical protein